MKKKTLPSSEFEAITQQLRGAIRKRIEGSKENTKRSIAAALGKARESGSVHVQDITVICIEGLHFICTYMTNDDNTSFDEEIVLRSCTV